MSTISALVTDETAKKYFLYHVKIEGATREQKIEVLTRSWEECAQELIDAAGRYSDRRRVKAMSLATWRHYALCYLYLFHGESWLIRFKANLEAAGLSQKAATEIERNIKREAPGALEEIKRDLIKEQRLMEQRKNGTLPSLKETRDNHKCVKPNCGRIYLEGEV